MQGRSGLAVAREGEAVDGFVVEEQFHAAAVAERG